MSDMFRKLCLLAALALSAPAMAQETTSSDTPQAGAEAPAERDDGLSTGTPELKVGDPYVVSVHTDWELRCVKAPEGTKEPCQMYQLLNDQRGNSVAEINLFNLPNDPQLAAGATIITPLETLLTRQLRLSIDGAPAKQYPFTFCTSIGCIARIGLTPGEIAAMKAGAVANILIVPAKAPDQTVDLTMSLSGFTAGFDAVIEANK
ncbi:MAG: invasion associated locus B family protein [Paracoccaceae bacterium]